MKGRRAFLRLLYWREIVSEKKGLRWEVYQEGRKEIGRDKEAWCDYTKKMMTEVGLEECWEKQDVMEVDKGTWRSIVWKKIQDKEQEKWRANMEGKSKLRTYRDMKKDLEMERYLKEGTAQQRRVMVMIRGGTNDLRIETGRYEKLEKEERICIFCDSGEVEDESHFLCRCAAWKEERELVLREVRKQGVRMKDEEVMFLSGQALERKGQARVKSWRKIVLKGVMMMERKRKREWKRIRMGVEEQGRTRDSSSSGDDVGGGASMLAYAADLLLGGGQVVVR